MPPTTTNTLPLLSPSPTQNRTPSCAGLDFDVVNPVTGHRARRQTPAEGAGDGAAVVEFEFTLPARSAGAPRHVHTRITETFIVVAGQLLVEVGERGHFVVLRAGEAGWRVRGVPTEYAPRAGRSKVTGTVRGTVRAISDMSAFLRAGPRDGS